MKPSTVILIIAGAVFLISVPVALFFFMSTPFEEAPSTTIVAPTAVPASPTSIPPTVTPTRHVIIQMTPPPTPIVTVAPDFGCSADQSGTEGCQNIGRAALEKAGCPSFSTINCDHQCATHKEYWYPNCKKK